MQKVLAARVIEELQSFGIACGQEQVDLLVKHLLLVIERNKSVNLTRITDPLEAVSLHVVDSLLPLACSDVKLDSRSAFLDMGTGAGYPGIPLAIMTGATATLVDSVGKKVAAVADFATALPLGHVSAINARLEELAPRMPHSQEYVFARAVAKTNVLIEYATPFLRKGGRLVVEKARPDEDEIQCADRAARLCGLTFVSREAFELPHDLGHREILIYRRVRHASVQLPRRTGLAKSSPLGCS